MNNWKIHFRLISGDPACGQRIRVNLSLTNNPSEVTCVRCLKVASREDEASKRGSAMSCSESKHTRGPWWNSGLEVGSGPTMAIKVAKVSGANYPEAEANARLIAAAPELLEALTELLAAQLASYPSSEAGKEAQDAWADRRAAARNNASAIIARLS